MVGPDFFSSIFDELQKTLWKPVNCKSFLPLEIFWEIGKRATNPWRSETNWKTATH